jgi:hypothetical protein
VGIIADQLAEDLDGIDPRELAEHFRAAASLTMQQLGGMLGWAQQEQDKPVYRLAYTLVHDAANDVATDGRRPVGPQRRLQVVSEQPGADQEAAAAGLSYDITPSRDGYTGPAIHLTWQNSVGIARADDPRCPVPWVLVPTSLLNRLAAETYESGSRALSEEALSLIRQAPIADYGPNGECSLCGAFAAAWSDICNECIARGNPA